MIGKSLAVTTALVLATIPDVFAFNEPDGFRGVPWGTSEYELVKAIGRQTPQWAGCSAFTESQRWIGDRGCTGPFDLAGIQVSAVYMFRDDRFSKVNLQFPSRDFGRMTAIFIERYGQPTKRSNDSIWWIGTQTEISLHQYLTDVTKGFASIMTQAEARESKRLHDEQTKGAAKGL